MANDHDRLIVQPRNATHDCVVISEVTISRKRCVFGKNFIDITGHVIATIELTKGFQLDTFKSAIKDSSMGLVILGFSAKLKGEDDYLNFINDGLRKNSDDYPEFIEGVEITLV